MPRARRPVALSSCHLVRAQVKQARTASSYEFKVLRMNDWMVEQKYEPFCHVVEVSAKRYCVELLADDGEVRLYLVVCACGACVRCGWMRRIAVQMYTCAFTCACVAAA